MVTTPDYRFIRKMTFDIALLRDRFHVVQVRKRSAAGGSKMNIPAHVSTEASRRRRGSKVAWRLRYLIALAAASVASLVFAAAASADTICNNFGGTICCGNQSWGSFTHTNKASWSGDAGKRYYARRRDTNFVLTFNMLMPNGGPLFEDFGTVAFRGTGLYKGEQTVMNYAVTDSTTTSC